MPPKGHRDPLSTIGDIKDRDGQHYCAYMTLNELGPKRYQECPWRHTRASANADLLRMRATPTGRAGVPDTVAAIKAEAKAAAATVEATSGGGGSITITPQKSSTIGGSSSGKATPPKIPQINADANTKRSPARRRWSQKGSPERNSMSASAASSDAAAPKTSSPQRSTSTLNAGLPVFQQFWDEVGLDSDSEMPELHSECCDAAKAERACSAAGSPPQLMDTFSQGEIKIHENDGKWCVFFTALRVAGPPRDDKARAQKDLTFVQQATSAQDAKEKIIRLYEVAATMAAAKEEWLRKGGRTLSPESWKDKYGEGDAHNGAASHGMGAKTSEIHKKWGEAPDYPPAVWASFRSSVLPGCGPVAPVIARIAEAVDRKIAEAAETSFK